MFVPPQLIIGVVLAATCFGGGWMVNDWRRDAQALAEKDAAEKALQLAAQAIAKIDVKAVTINRKLEKEVRENNFYSACTISPDGMLSLREAYGEPAADDKLPTPSSPDRPDDGGKTD